ncbi:condensation domain-containing protein [Amycolatopsis pithecellobii]|uniref:Condensation domain-containing protein n=1 Tax=Amycolatopsis pithecellobii TaxID=664692 RepID=A0A6N7Z342_9PSEU|nr:condensation domain-containing protein [Amycolatopsis pithecellobii]MTD54460.1 hypothetical protein [Amycolatopsis pithecellobii]
MTAIDALLGKLRTLDVRLAAAGDALRYDAPSGTLSPGLLTELRHHKPALLAHLSGILGVAPVSAQQETMLSAVMQAPRPEVFNVPTRIWLTGRLDVTALGTAIDALVRRHAGLRSRFVRDHTGNWVQQALAPQPVPLPVEDLRGRPPQDVEQACQALADTPFDLRRSTVPVCRLFQVDDDRWALMLVTHHIATDGWALSVVLRELAELYRAAAGGTEPRLAAPSAQPADYARRQRGQTGTERKLPFWRAHLDGASLAQLPTDRPAPARSTGAGDTVRRAVPRSTRAAVEAFARSHEVTPCAVAVAALGRWLAGLSGGGDILLKLSYANREHRELESLVSCSRIGLGVLMRDAGRVPFGELVEQVGRHLPAAIDNALPLEDVLGAGRAPQLAFAYQQLPGPEVTFAGLATRIEDVAAAAARAELTLGLGPTAAWLEYATDLRDPATAAGLLDGYLDGLVAQCQM